jgi:outer membrane protein, heavy metal efflux system
MPNRIRAVVIPLVLALGACAQFEPRPVSVPAVAQRIETRGLSAPELLAYVRHRVGRDAPPWDFEALSAAAFFYSPALDVARAQLATAEAARITASQRPLATLTLPLEYTTNPKPDESPYTFGLALDIPIETAGKRSHRIAQADSLSLAARQDIGTAAWRVRSQLRDHLLDVWDARTRSSLLALQLQQREALVRFLEHRVDAGEAARPELFQARADLARDRSQRAAAQRQAAQALAAAAAVIGVPLPALQSVALDLDAFSVLPPMPSRSQAVDAALRNRADIQAVLARYGASQAALQLAIAGQYPDIHLGPGFTYDAGAHKIAFNVSGIPLPVFGTPKGAIAESRARRDEAAAQVEQAVAAALARVDQAFATLAPNRTDLRATDSEVQAQAALVRAARDALRHGEDDRVNLLRAEIAAAGATLERHAALVQLQRAAGTVEDAVQRPLGDELAQTPSRSAP